MDYSMPGFPIHHQLLELAQTHVHRVSDTRHHQCVHSRIEIPSTSPQIIGLNEKDVTIFQELNEIPTHNQLVKVSEVLAGFFSRAQADLKKKKKLKINYRLCSDPEQTVWENTKVRTSAKKIDFPVARGGKSKQFYE